MTKQMTAEERALEFLTEWRGNPELFDEKVMNLAITIRAAEQAARREENAACAKLIQKCVDDGNLMTIVDLYTVKDKADD